MKQRKIILCLLLALVLPFLLAESQYSLRPGDVVEISVYDEPDLKTITRVSSGGEISFPLLGSLSVKGLSTEGVEDLLKAKLKAGDYLIDPKLSVYIKEYSELKVYVYGSVRNPGAYKFMRETPSILKAIAMAGGLEEEAYDTEIRIIRQGKGSRKFVTFTVDMQDIIKGAKGLFDLPLENGDIVSVPEAPPIYVFGEVSKEGIVYYKKDMRILQAVTMAGGFTEKVSRKKIMVLRLNEDTNELEMMMVNFELIIEKADQSANIIIRPYDIIIAPESWL